MYRAFNSTTVRQLGLKTNGSAIAFRHVRQQQQRRPAASIRLVLLNPNVSTKRMVHIQRGLLRSEQQKIMSEEKETMTSRAAALAKEQQAKATLNTATTTVKPKKTIWEKVKEEAIHYWHGTKLLGLEVRISSALTWKLLNGGKLTRREHRQLRRTTSDLMRLIPFAFFIIVPFMEFLLPVALKLFPNMLPSTYESKSQEEKKKMQLLKVRLEMAKFLQETISESGFPGSDHEKAALEFADFFRKIRMTGEQASTEDLLNVAKRFEDELTLDNLSRPQLVSMCRYMNINAFGTDNFLRFQIRNRMRQIKADDRVIQAEGIESLTIQELQNACASRGIRAIGTSPGRLRDELAQWLDLHLNHHVPGTLLILSRAFSYTDRGMTTEEALKATFNSLPDNLVNEAELQVLEQVGASTYKQKLDVLEQQQELIEDESEQEEKEEKARLEAAKAEEARLEAEKKEREAAAEKRDEFIPETPVVSDVHVVERKETTTPPAADTTTTTTASTTTASTTTDTETHKADTVAPPEETPLSDEQKSQLEEALTKLRTKVDLLEERAQLNDIKIQHEDYKELIEELKDATKRDADKAILRMGKRLEKMLAAIDKELDAMEKDLSTKKEETKIEESTDVKIEEEKKK
ncbi:LETM1-like protein-domain-containing protein [Cokeromyces recurvatus]|uniref:LETM1-like protein-domain-containing protein n=1 Tax=Cokeromyces recurvatus TaxID=90255 RepID=UPI00221F9CD0|nr:LETM1-like protein-domain-containing protein [Cokeromyces recurvatus]KAI7901415.1 LETM1-like protein-domain-containing protein [Cokeromyces recurvatus]